MIYTRAVSYEAALFLFWEVNMEDDKKIVEETENKALEGRSEDNDHALKAGRYR